MDANVLQQILGLLAEARQQHPQGWESPAAAAAALAAALMLAAPAAGPAAAGPAVAAEAPPPAPDAALRPLKKPKTGSSFDGGPCEAAASAAHSPPMGSTGHDAHMASSSADGSEWHHYGPVSSSRGLNLDDQATPTTLHGPAGAMTAGSSPTFSHNQQQPHHHHHQQQQKLHHHLLLMQQQQQQQQQQQDGQATPTTLCAHTASASTSPGFSNSSLTLQLRDETPLHHDEPLRALPTPAAAGVHAAREARRMSDAEADAAAAAAIAAAADAAQEQLADGPAELSTQERLLQVTMLDRLFDLTCTRFSIKDGVVAPRKFFPRLQHGSPMPIQLLLQVHAADWDPNSYTSHALLQLGAAVRSNRAAAAAAADGSPAGYAAVWAQYLSVKMHHHQQQQQAGATDGGSGDDSGSAGAAAGTAAAAGDDTTGSGGGGDSVTFGPYPAILVPGQNAFGGLLRVRNIKHNGELKALQCTPHVLVLREKVGADVIKLHIKLSSSTVASLAKKAGVGWAAGKESWAAAGNGMTPPRSPYSRLPTPSAAIAAAAAAAAAAGAADAAGKLMRAPRARGRADAAAAPSAAAAAAAAMAAPYGAAQAAGGGPGDADTQLAQALLDLKHVR